MYAKLINFQTGWYEVNIGIKAQEIDVLIGLLRQIQEGRIDHMQLSGDYEGEGGIGDIIFEYVKSYV